MKNIIYHGNCPDGMAAAWVLNRHFIKQGETVRLIPGSYGMEPPDIAGDLILADFCFEPDDLETLSVRADSITVLDHHETSLDWLKEFKDPDETIIETWDAKHAKQTEILVLDQNHSGAMLAHLWTGEPHCPPFIPHIEDRDLWRFRLSGTRDLMAAVLSYPFTLESYDYFMTKGVQPLVHEGKPILRYQANLIEQIMREAYQADVFGHEGIWIAACPYTLGSDVAGALAQRDPDRFAATYVDKPNDVRRWGLRSAPTGLNVADLAHSWAGGGGHPHAAGLETTRSYPS